MPGQKMFCSRIGLPERSVVFGYNEQVTLKVFPKVFFFSCLCIADPRVFAELESAGKKSSIISRPRWDITFVNAKTAFCVSIELCNSCLKLMVQMQFVKVGRGFNIVI